MRQLNKSTTKIPCLKTCLSRFPMRLTTQHHLCFLTQHLICLSPIKIITHPLWSLLSTQHLPIWRHLHFPRLIPFQPHILTLQHLPTSLLNIGLTQFQTQISMRPPQEFPLLLHVPSLRRIPSLSYHQSPQHILSCWHLPLQWSFPTTQKVWSKIKHDWRQTNRWITWKRDISVVMESW